MGFEVSVLSSAHREIILNYMLISRSEMSYLRLETCVKSIFPDQNMLVLGVGLC